MGISVVIGTSAVFPWIPAAQVLVTAVSACTALAAATIAARAYGAGRADRKATEIDEVTVGIVDAWKAEKAMERANQAFDPFLKESERMRLRSSALAEMANVTHRSIWPAKIDFAVIEARRLIEDTDVAGDQISLEAAGRLISSLRKEVLEGVQTLQSLSEALGTDLADNQSKARDAVADRAMRLARMSRGRAAIQESRWIGNVEKTKRRPSSQKPTPPR